jgi:hypothetical protein
VRLKYLATGSVAGIAAAALAGAAAAGVTSIASAPQSAPAVAPVVFSAPLPLDPAADLPTNDELTTLLTGLADPSVPFHSKSGLIEGGVGIIEGHTADSLMKNAAAKGELPLSFQVSNITSAAPGTATATVVATGPQLAPVTQVVTFVDEGGWKLSRSSAMALLQAASGGGSSSG